jgi:hypothetical protein
MITGVSLATGNSTYPGITAGQKVIDMNFSIVSLVQECTMKNFVNSVDIQNGQYRAKHESNLKACVETRDEAPRTGDGIVRSMQECIVNINGLIGSIYCNLKQHLYTCLFPSLISGWQLIPRSSGYAKLTTLKPYYMLENLKSFHGRKETHMKDETISRELLETDLAWLAGIVDGEAHMLISDHPQASQDKHGFYTKRVRVSINNTDVRMIKRISEIWKALGVTFHYFLRMSRDKNIKHRNALSIESDGKRNMFKILSPIIKYLVSKQDQAQVCLDYVEYRMNRGKPRSSNGRLISTMSEQDELYQRKLEDVRKNLKDPSETKRKAGEILMI